MDTPLAQHQTEIERNLAAWRRKPLLQAVYTGFYRRLLEHIDPSVPGRIVEIGSGMGNLRQHLPSAICTDLFPNPWLDLVCDGYDLPFRDGSLSHLVLMDVFHHLEAPTAFMEEARRVVVPGGRVVLLEPFISLLSRPIYSLFHHEPVAWKAAISGAAALPRPRRYYAAQGNATRLFFSRERGAWPPGWTLLRGEAFAAMSYLCSGGFSGPQSAPLACLPVLARLDAWLSRWPWLWGVRCLVALRREA